MIVDYAVSDNCQNLMESYGEICVHCNKCGKFCEGCVRPKESFCGICSRNPEIVDQYVSGEAERGEDG